MLGQIQTSETSTDVIAIKCYKLLISTYLSHKDITSSIRQWSRCLHVRLLLIIHLRNVTIFPYLLLLSKFVKNISIFIVHLTGVLQVQILTTTNRKCHRLSIFNIVIKIDRPEGKRPLGRPRRRWKDNIKMDLQEVWGGRGDWMELAQDRDRSRALVSTLRDIRVS
jgi:hypothetical protein